MNLNMAAAIFSRKTWVTFCISIILVLDVAYFFGSGIDQCHYSLFEDQEILQATSDIKQNGFVKVFLEQMHYETRGRFRPLFVAYRLGASAILGNDIQLHHYFFYSLFVVNTIVFFALGLTFGFPPLISLLFTLLVFVGPQTAVGWRLANGENLALIFLGSGMIFFLWGLKTVNTKFFVVSILLILTATFSKESFIFCYCLLPLLYINKTDNSKNSWVKFWQISGLIVLLICLYAICVRFLLHNPDEMKYAGSSISVKDILRLQFGISSTRSLSFERIWRTIIFHGSAFQPYTFLMSFGFLFLLSNVTLRNKILFSLVIVLGFLVIHKLLYLRLAMYKIYLFPVIVGMAFLVVHWLNELFKARKKFFFIIFLTSVIGVLVVQGKLAFFLGSAFSSENKGAATTTGLIAKNCESHDTYIQADPLMHGECIYSIMAGMRLAGCSKTPSVLPKEEGDSAEALDIMRFTDPTFVPFLREQFYQQFSSYITDSVPENILNGENIWVIMQRPNRPRPTFKEVTQNHYTQYFYRDPQFYSVSVLIPK